MLGYSCEKVDLVCVTLEGLLNLFANLDSFSPDKVLALFYLLRVIIEIFSD